MFPPSKAEGWMLEAICLGGSADLCKVVVILLRGPLLAILGPVGKVGERQGSTGIVCMERWIKRLTAASGYLSMSEGLDHKMGNHPQLGQHFRCFNNYSSARVILGIEELPRGLRVDPKALALCGRGDSSVGVAQMWLS